ncbi:hypothetical protein BD626DRAFT_572012 [Schizophyllum amplum]|uniref:Uncharacterized protein n=1 Tax=Schizophyllum amplum TaxID=97359 RepID=A0A550C611_9AGAR|nr:hypothetical protein BD626DRAFT_572012 [Auriculariopsis ampla]
MMFGHNLTSTWANAFAGRSRSFGIWVTLEALCGAGVFAMYGRPMCVAICSGTGH